MTKINDISPSSDRRYYTIKRSFALPHFNDRHLKKVVKFQTQTQYWTCNGLVYCGPSLTTTSILFRNEQELIEAGYTLREENHDADQ